VRTARELAFDRDHCTFGPARRDKTSPRSSALSSQKAPMAVGVIGLVLGRWDS